MDYMFATFSSGTVARRAQEFLTRNGIVCSIIMTPSQIGLGCGKGVKFSHFDFDRVLSLLGRSHPSFTGYFLVSYSASGKRTYTRY